MGGHSSLSCYFQGDLICYMAKSISQGDFSRWQEQDGIRADGLPSFQGTRLPDLRVVTLFTHPSPRMPTHSDPKKHSKALFPQPFAGDKRTLLPRRNILNSNHPSFGLHLAYRQRLLQKKRGGEQLDEKRDTEQGWVTERSTPGQILNSAQGTGTTQLHEAPTVAILPAHWSTAHHSANFSNLNSKSHYLCLC